MVPRRGFDEAAVLDVEETVRAIKADERERDTWRFFYYFNRDKGIARRMTRREWIERYVRIRDIQGNVIPLKLNRAQRRLEAWVLRMERRGMPVRIVILKARQMGFSTYVQAVFFERIMRGVNVRALIVAHKDITSKRLLEMARFMAKRISKGAGEFWDLKFEGWARGRIAIAQPIMGDLVVASAEEDDPAHGFTYQCLHLSETSRWPRPENTVRGILPPLHPVPGTYGFSESTANGDTGWFREQFWSAWKERGKPLDARRSGWVALFFPWIDHYEYRWTQTYGHGRELPEELVDEIRATLDDEEAELLKMTCRYRGLGEMKVDYDQLAWRRRKIAELESAAKGQSGIDLFHEQYPVRPEEAFLASGRPLFDTSKIDAMIAGTAEEDPAWQGELLDYGDTSSLPAMTAEALVTKMKQGIG